MAIEQLFSSIQELREAAHWRAVFGDPQVVGEQTIIPVAKIGYTFGSGFGQGGGPAEEGKPPTQGEGGGAGGAVSAKPMGVIVVTPDDVYFEETVDESRVAMLGMFVGALFIWQLLKTVRAIFGK